MIKTHSYQPCLRWTGNEGTGTSGYQAYGRGHDITASNKPTIVGSSDPAFRGDATRWSPEELFVASISQCHMLWYLHLASSAGVVVTAYLDEPIGTMTENADGSGQFDDVLLRPTVTITDGRMRERAAGLHEDVAAMCFISRSVNFRIRHEAKVLFDA